jgi:hypothetical protein
MPKPAMLAAGAVVLVAVIMSVNTVLGGATGRVADTTTKPAVTTTKPADTTTKPADTTTKPAVTTTKPADSQAAVTTTKPADSQAAVTTNKPASSVSVIDLSFMPIAIAAVIIAIALIAYAYLSAPEPMDAYQRRNQGRFDSYGPGYNISEPVVVGDEFNKVFQYHPTYSRYRHWAS